MRALIAITTCERYRQNGNNDAARATWIPDVAAVDGLDYMFFTGRDTVFVNKDEVRLDVADDYANVPYKTIESRRWAANNGYDFVFQTYPDVYLRPERLMAALQAYGPDKEYVGWPLIDPTTKIPYASGGAGYWQSRRTYEMLLNTNEPYDWAEDRWVGKVMRANGVTLWSDDRYGSVPRAVLKRNSRITSHLSRCLVDGQEGKFDKQWVLNAHKFWVLSQSI